MEGLAYLGTYRVQYSRYLGNSNDVPVHVDAEAVQSVQSSRKTRNIVQIVCEGLGKQKIGIKQSS